MLTHPILTMNLYRGYHFNLHFTAKETEGELFHNLSKVTDLVSAKQGYEPRESSCSTSAFQALMYIQSPGNPVVTQIWIQYICSRGRQILHF